MLAFTRLGVLIVVSACAATSSGGASPETAPKEGAQAPTEDPPMSKPTSPKAAAAEPARTLHFSDGSGNAFILTEVGDTASLEYDPVTPERSSSGTYSGGTPADVVLSGEQAAEIWRRAGELQKSSQVSTGARSMGTGAFVLSGTASDARFIVGRSDELVDFTTFMRGLVGQ